MNRGFSCYLDLIRVGAALLVFLHHLSLDFGCYAAPGSGCVLVPFHAGHSAVVLFFVLSGYVITYVAHERERTLSAFAAARIARIYSVAVPVLVLVMALDGLSYATGYYAGVPWYQYRSVWKYLAVALSFTTDHWFLAENAFSLGAWWSVAYEVWYYVLFAAAFYARGPWRWILPLAVGAVMGPKLLAMFPLWLLGSLVYLLHRRVPSWPAPAAAVLFALTLLGVAALLLSSATLGVDAWTDALSGGWITRRLRFSQWFAGDLVIASVFALNLFAARYLRFAFGWLAAPIRFAAAYTFTFYMIHGPVLKAFARYVDDSMLPTALATLAFTFAFGAVTERQKDHLRQWLARVAMYARVPAASSRSP